MFRGHTESVFGTNNNEYEQTELVKYGGWKNANILSRNAHFPIGTHTHTTLTLNLLEINYVHIVHSTASFRPYTSTNTAN